jgi:hypothetical protein
MDIIKVITDYFESFVVDSEDVIFANFNNIIGFINILINSKYLNDYFT